VERLEREEQIRTGPDVPTDIGHLNHRIADLEERLNEYLAGGYAHGTASSPVRDVDSIVGLEAQAVVARELIQRFEDDVSVEVPPDPGADLMVRSGDRSWVFEFKGGGSVDLTPSFRHLALLAKRLHARPVLVSPQSTGTEVEAMATSSGVLVSRPDDLKELLSEIEAYIGRSSPRSAAARGRKKARGEPQRRASKPRVKDE
jgi:hypothetical protein